jgi:hypothetical protein
MIAITAMFTRTVFRWTEPITAIPGTKRCRGYSKSTGNGRDSERFRAIKGFFAQGVLSHGPIVGA